MIGGGIIVGLVAVIYWQQIRIRDLVKTAEYLRRRLHMCQSALVKVTR